MLTRALPGGGGNAGLKRRADIVGSGNPTDWARVISPEDTPGSYDSQATAKGASHV